MILKIYLEYFFRIRIERFLEITATYFNINRKWVNKSF